VVAVLAVTLLAGLLAGRFVVAGGDGAAVARLQAELW
jgi:hypothetical protein